MSLSFFDINYISLHFILFADIVLNALVEYEALFTSASTYPLTIQVCVQLFGLIVILLLLGSTRNFQTGAWRKVYHEFGGAILANISYVISTIALHVITLKNYQHILPQLTISLVQKASKDFMHQSKPV